MQGNNSKFSPWVCFYGVSVIDGDLLVEIFKRLPIQSLCRFRSVCRLWNSLISSTLSINLHLSFTCSSIPLNLKPYLHVADRRYRSLRLSNFTNLIHKGYALWRPLDSIEHFEQQLYFPFRADREKGHKIFTFVDVILGIVCISYSWFTSYRDLPHPCFNSILLWNPTIQKYVALPSLRLPDCYYAMGFGYDTSGKDFKVVLILIQSSTYRVYSNRLGSWETGAADGIKLESYWDFIGYDRPTFVNGTIHWILGSQKPSIDKWRYSVLMFECESDEFRRVRIPETLYAGTVLSIELFEYAGMLAAMVCGGSTMAPSTDVWVMEEHGISTSWKKLYVLRECGGIIRCDPSFEKLSPYGPKNPWNKYNCGFSIYRRYIDRVYDETMLLMDHPEAQSYTNNEVVTILTEDPN